jgi:hypothetical protein
MAGLRPLSVHDQDRGVRKAGTIERARCVIEVMAGVLQALAGVPEAVEPPAERLAGQPPAEMVIGGPGIPMVFDPIAHALSGQRDNLTI